MQKDGFMIGSECADWWEKRNKAYHAELEQYVLENPGYFAIFVATTKATAADFAMTMYVDLARIGEGFAQGGVKGFATDIFRVLNFVPEAKLLQGSKTLLGRATQMAANFTVWRKIDGSLCVPIAIAQALQHGGYRIGVGLGEIADKLGVSLLSLFKHGLMEWTAIRRALTKLGMTYSELSGPMYGSWQSVLRAAQESTGPILLRIRTITDEGHAILVGRTPGGIRIIDRYGTFRDLDELGRYYRVSGWYVDTTQPMFAIANAVIDESLMKLVAQGDLLACLVRQAFAVFDLNHSRVTKEQLSADFDAFLAKKGLPPVGTPQKTVIKLPELSINAGTIVTVLPSSPSTATLSGIAKAHYNDFNLWPLIYDQNRDVIGPNPNRLTPGMKLRILPIATYSQADIASARKRAPTWRQHAA